MSKVSFDQKSQYVDPCTTFTSDVIQGQSFVISITWVRKVVQVDVTYDRIRHDIFTWPQMTLTFDLEWPAQHAPKTILVPRITFTTFNLIKATLKSTWPFTWDDTQTLITIKQSYTHPPTLLPVRLGQTILRYFNIQAVQEFVAHGQG